MASVQDSVDPSVLYELKQQAIEYYAQNGVPQKMEEILNSMFYDKPNDVFGHMVSEFLDIISCPAFCTTILPV